MREAIHRSIDVEAIKRTVMRGQSFPTNLMVAPGINGYMKDLDKRPALLKPEEAKKMLADAGYPNGFEVGMDCPNDRYVNDEKICQAVVAMLAKIGVKVNLQAPDPQPLLRQDPAQERPVAGRDELLHARLVAGPDLRRAQRLRGPDPDARTRRPRRASSTPAATRTPRSTSSPTPWSRRPTRPSATP